MLDLHCFSGVVPTLKEKTALCFFYSFFLHSNFLFLENPLTDLLFLIISDKLEFTISVLGETTVMITTCVDSYKADSK